MKIAITEYQRTPNPNALKCVLAGSAGSTIRSFRSAAEAANDPIGAALFGVKGVMTLLINDAWITVNKAPEAEWSAVKRGVEKALAGLSGESSGTAEKPRGRARGEANASG